MTSLQTRIFPLLFVVLWSTGFIGARLGLPHIEPMTFLFIRYVLVIACMTAIAVLTRAPWPSSGTAWLHIGVSGLLIHGIYLGGVFMAISMGLPAGVTSLVVSVQPLLTAVGAGWLLGTQVSRSQWLGLTVGFIGVGLVVAAKAGTEFGLMSLVPAIAALLAITAGTLYQKRFCPAFDWRTGAVAQFLPTAAVTLLLALATETGHIDWTGELFFALGWLVLVLSIGAISLLNWLIRHNSSVNVSSLFYLVPPCTVLFAWMLFGDTFSGIAIPGMALTVWGVYLARK
ncbi:DMT family transporter [Candidatus Aalborgicola defluviihabitans]|mgnify:CR=1 FL=1|uniref:DMT family transporter n=1 Tax=Candidatus Aalborgicola defluviihabitans TaxID=3386187 RepID=UPI001E0C029A|nr:EamA family transporter [Burkholderiales bacterium]MBK6567646.1 EamA family transporter [Burkholderiales bacterium]MBK7282310.1 EamA family transporter [Burkholderiales bacterium]MBK7314063.1 EamA family transporter [Burkholderiales bacterium]MBL0245203.1 EamA family transporter [Rhodoferax sp.]